MNRFLKVIFFLLISDFAKAEFRISSFSKNVCIENDRLYEENVITGTLIPDKVYLLSVALNELDQINSISAYYQIEGHKRVELKPNHIFLSQYETGESDFTGRRTLTFNFIEPVKEAKIFIRFHRVLDQPILLTSVQFALISASRKIENYIIPQKGELQIVVPSTFRFHHYSKSKYTVDSLTHPEGISFRLTQHNDSYESYSPILTCIYPGNYNSSSAFIGYWLDSLVLSLPALKPELITDLFSGKADQESIIRTAFNFVTRQFTYISIENGIQGFKPHDPNLIIINKKGDCKDLSNLLVQLLKSQGVEAYLAIGPTHMYPYDLTVPGLGGANHAICAVKDQKGNYFFLDPTEAFSNYNNAGRGSTGKKFLVIGKTSELITVTPFKNIPAVDSLYIDINVQDNPTGTFQFTSKGLSETKWLQAINGYSSSTTERFICNMLLNEKLQPATEIKFLHKDKVAISGNIQPVVQVIEVDTNSYISLGFLPLLRTNLDPYPHIEHYSVRLHFNTPRKFKVLPYYEFISKDFKIKGQAKAKSGNELEIIYSTEYIGGDIKEYVNKLKDFEKSFFSTICTN